MSVKLMSAIFETEFRDLQDNEGNTTKAATAKLVLLALADHANDEGEGAYPGLTKMELKTALSRPAIINTYDALKHNGIIFLVGQSKRNTNNYTINTRSFPRANGDSKPALLVNSITEDSKPSLPEVVNPVYPNHPLTVIKTSPVLTEKEIQQVNAKVDAIIANGQNKDWTEILHNFERVFGFGELPWYSTGVWEKFAKFLIKSGGQWFADYVAWRNGDGKYKAFSNKKIRENPAAFMDTGYPEYEASKMYRSPDQPQRGSMIRTIGHTDAILSRHVEQSQFFNLLLQYHIHYNTFRGGIILVAHAL